MEKYILEIPNFMPTEVCESIIEKFEDDNRKNRGYYYYNLGNRVVKRDKLNDELTITNCPGWENLHQICVDHIYKAHNAYSKHLTETFKEYNYDNHIYERQMNCKDIEATGIPVQRIGKGGLYAWHHDGDVSKPYFIQALFYLNTLQENQGGCTEFIDGKKVRPETGKVLIYPCSWTFPHKGGEVLDGYKYICTTMINTQM